MRRLALLTVVTMLALPGVAGAATFSARVVRAGAGVLTVRLADGAIVRYSGARAASASARSPLLAHAAREAAGGPVALNLRTLDPGVTVLVTAERGGAVITLPGPSAPEQHATGVVSIVQGDAFVLELPDRTPLRLHMHARVRACETMGVSYHQDAGVLVADSIRRGPSRQRGHGCGAQSFQGAITALSARGVTIGHRSFKAAPATIAGFRVGDEVDVSYVPGAMIARQVEYVQRVARGTVTAAGDGSMTIADGATGRPQTFSTGAQVAAGPHVVLVYHRSAGGPVADVVYAFAS